MSDKLLQTAPLELPPQQEGIIKVPHPMAKLARHILTQAASLIERRGWCQVHLAETEEGEAISPSHLEAVRFSLTGAVAKSLRQVMLKCQGDGVRFNPYISNESIENDLQFYTKQAIDSLVSCSWAWNDSPERTAKEVVGLLYEAALNIRYLNNDFSFIERYNPQADLEN